MTKKKRIYQIDLFRFLAALAVVLFHYTFRGYAANDMSIIEYRELGEVFKYGYLGLDLFFMISGFVILLSIKHNSVVKFAVSRITRLYPTYWAAVFLTFLVTVIWGAPRYNVGFGQLLVNMTMFQNYVGVESIDGAYWSLFVEMKFYIFIVAAYLIINRFRELKLDYLIYGWLILSLVYVVFPEVFLVKVLNYFLILYWSSYFIAGIIFYQIFSRGLKLMDWIPLALCYTLSMFHGIQRIETMNAHYHGDLSPYVVGGVISLCYVAMFLVAIDKLKCLNSSKLLKLGMLTYPLYLIHQNIGFIVFNNLDSYVDKYILLSATLAIMLLCSYLISAFYEPKVSTLLNVRLKNIAKRF